jgi:hypothetical protein
MMIEDDNELRAPWIYSPIDGEAIGRIRLRQNDTKYDGCDNDGLFIVGTGVWQGMCDVIYLIQVFKNIKK